jgi:integrase
MRLTNTSVAAIAVPSGKSEIIVFDELIPGFGIRVRAGGSRRFIYQYKIGKQNRRLTLRGRDAKQARDAALIEQAKLTLGQDPALARQDAQDAASDTFKRCVDRYLALPQGNRRDSTVKEIRRHLERNLAPLHRLHIKQVDRRRVAIELTRLTVECGPVQSNRTRASLSRFFNWCIGEGYVDINIALATNKNDERPRDRVLDDDELRAVWGALPDNDYGDIIKLLTLTGQRAKEISELRWSEIDLKNAIITLPKSRTKNNRKHSIPLAGMALAILKARKREDGRDHVFGQGAGGFSGWSRCKERLDQVVKLAPWTVHDLRRSVATGMGALKVKPHIIEVVLNHISGFRNGVAGVYNLADYEDEKREALKAWDKHMRKVTA